MTSPVTSLAAPARTYQVRTYGCQMNVHDSERLAGMLEAAGYQRAADDADADVVVFNTCAVRENADTANEIEKKIKEKLGIGAVVTDEDVLPAPVDF